MICVREGKKFSMWIKWMGTVFKMWSKKIQEESLSTEFGSQREQVGLGEAAGRTQRDRK